LYILYCPHLDVRTIYPKYDHPEGLGGVQGREPIWAFWGKSCGNVHTNVRVGG
jgi:hypothetical protein